MDLDLTILEELINIYSPSNHEQDLCNYIKNIPVKNFKLINRQITSLTYYLDNKSDKTLLVDAHIDEVCSKIINITTEGFILATGVGQSSKMMFARPAKIMSSKLNKLVSGVYLNDVPHIARTRKKYRDKYNENMLYFDIGVKTKEEALEKVEIGDPIIPDYTYSYLNDNMFVGRALDNKVGTFILIKLLKYFDKNKDKSKYNLLFNFSGKEETGSISYLQFQKFKIHSILVLDTAWSTDVPFIDDNKYGDINLGDGIVISRGSDDSGLFDVFRNLSKTHKIPLQIEYPMGGSTNLGAFSKFNTFTQNIAIPIRNIHSPTEIINIDDIRKMYELLKLFIKYS